MTIVTLDFETERIEPRPKYPPEPVGVALKVWGREPVYMAWGHPSGNNCTREDALGVLRSLWGDHSISFLCHNAAFDMSVAQERLDLFPLPWSRVHDTMFLLFLFDPHAQLGLKPASERLLHWPAEEQDELHDWIWQHRTALVAEYGGKITRAKSGANSPGAWIAKAPGGLVGRYAKGDVRRTTALFKHLHPLIRSRGMEAAYDRERRLLPIFMENEAVGLRVDAAALERDLPAYRTALEQVEGQMRRYLGASGLSFDNDRDVASAFEAAGVVQPGAWVRTEKSGQLSVAKDSLPPEAFTDPLFAGAFGYRNRLVTCLKMFMEPWLEQARLNNGFIHTQWNQVRGSRGGARTGRPSMTKPNLLNVSKDFAGRSDGYEHPAALDLPILPLVRRYVLPDEGDVFLHRDFSGQEVRIFAHFESGALAEAYRNDPRLDPHEWLRAEILATTGNALERTRVKNVTFARLYGGGAGAVQAQARTKSLQEAREIIAFHDAALPGRRILSNEIMRIVRRGDPVRTWGGRLYHVEPPKVIQGKRQTYEYKMINYLVQGSAADITKEVICQWWEGGGASMGARFLLTVYDEINLSAPRDVLRECNDFLRDLMEGVDLDVPMRSDGKAGPSWGDLEKMED
jgi:DNA polymerase I-like protein with 3'-5' exonuclease and polymerase domains